MMNYYKVFVKENKFSIIDYTPKDSDYSSFIKHYVEEGYKQVIFTSFKMVKLLQYIHENGGLLKKIELKTDLYNQKEQQRINKVIEIANQKNENTIILDDYLFHNDEDSVDLQSIKFKFNRLYYEILVTGIIKSQEAVSKTELIKILEDSDIN